MRFDLRLPAKVLFGWGRRSEIGALAAPLGRRAWMVAGSRTLERTGLIDDLCDALKAAGVGTVRLPVLTREPEVQDVDDLTSRVRHSVQPDDFLVAIGGGAAIDLGKATAAMAVQPESGTIRDYLEGVGRGFQLTAPPLPVLAIPTTSGTGAEATRNAVISNTTPPFKKSLRDDRMVPRAVLLDPELTASCPAAVTAHAGMDAVTQLIESFVTRNRNPLTRVMCLEGLRLAIPALPRAVEHPADRPAREAMAYAAFLSGAALANSGLGAAHGVAAALGVHCGIPHGLACAVMLPHTMRLNLDTCRADFARLGALFTGGAKASEEAAAEAAIRCIVELAKRVGVPGRLRDLGVQDSQLDALAPASRGNSMSGNPRELSDTELRDWLGQVW